MLALASGAEEPNQKKRINMTLENSADTQITTANRRKDLNRIALFQASRGGCEIKRSCRKPSNAE